MFFIFVFVFIFIIKILKYIKVINNIVYYKNDKFNYVYEK